MTPTVRAQDPDDADEAGDVSNADDSSLDRATSGHNAETVPDPDVDDPGAAGRQAAEEVDGLEHHTEPVTQPEEPAALDRAPHPPEGDG